MVVGDGSIRCNGRSEQGKEALSVCAQGLCKDAKPTKHTQTLTLRKARGIVRFWKGWCRARDSSEAIPPVVARIFSGDSTSPLTREARMWYLAWDSACLGGYAGRRVVVQSLRLDGKKFDKSKRWTYRKQNATKRKFVPCRQSTSL